MARAAAKLREVEVGAISDPTNGGEDTISKSQPYSVEVTIQGSSDLLFHRWNCEAVQAKAGAAKNSEAKRSDDVESYVYRDDNKQLCIPGEYLRGSIITAAKFRSDPRSPRKSAMDLFKAAIVAETILAPLGVTEWDYLDTRRVMIQRSGINRVRPAMKAGWQATFVLMIMLPEYVTRDMLRETIEAAGRLIGIGDFRPTYGRYGIVGYKVIGI